MKNLLSSTFFKSLLILICVSLSSFTVYSQVSFGIKGGLNVSTIHTSGGSGLNPSMDDYTSFHIGGLAEIPVSQLFFIQPELLFSVKGAKYEMIMSETAETESIALAGESTISSYYIEVPVYFKLKLDVGTSGKLHLGAGPYVAFGIAGQEKVSFKIKYQGQTVWSVSGNLELFDKDKMTMSNQGISMTTVTDDNMMKRFDAGLATFLAYELNNGLFVSANYDLGLYNTDNPNTTTITMSGGGQPSQTTTRKSNPSSKMYNRTFSLSIGYIF